MAKHYPVKVERIDSNEGIDIPGFLVPEGKNIGGYADIVNFHREVVDYMNCGREMRRRFRRALWLFRVSERKREMGDVIVQWIEENVIKGDDDDKLTTRHIWDAFYEAFSSDDDEEKDKPLGYDRRGLTDLVINVKRLDSPKQMWVGGSNYRGWRGLRISSA